MANKICIIPARGGSKRIPNKNIKSFCGSPIISYPIKAAIESNLFDEIMVSTDNHEIASCAIKYGAKVPFLRSEKNSDDFATTVNVIDEVLEKYSLEGINFDYACCIYPTAPFVTKEKLELGLNTLLQYSSTTVFPVAEFSYPISRALKLDSNNLLTMYFPENLNARSQDLSKAFHDVGQWYWLNLDKFKIEKLIYSSNSHCIKLEFQEYQDIDTLNDWKIAEFKYEFLQSIKR